MVVLFPVPSVYHVPPGCWGEGEEDWGRWETQELLLFRCYVASDSFVTSWTVGPPSSSVHEISQARTPEWVAISFSSA